jgi:mRNA-degrading endonuclease RelE of RelBE toxin-antitoxin system
MSSWTGRGPATRVYSSDFDADFFKAPARIQEQIERKLSEMGLRLADYPHYRLTGSPACRFRVGDYRVIYEFDVERNEIYVLGVGRRDQIYKRR